MLQITFELVRIQATGLFDLVHFLDRLKGDLQRVHEAVAEIEQAGDHRKFNNFLFVEDTAYMFKNIISRPRGVLRHVLRPHHGCFFPIIQKRGVHVRIAADDFDLFVGNACRLTKRRVMSQSITAPIGLAGLDDRHFFEFRCQATTAAFALHHPGEGG